jgi:hypothetical protein
LHLTGRPRGDNLVQLHRGLAQRDRDVTRTDTHRLPRGAESQAPDNEHDRVTGETGDRKVAADIADGAHAGTSLDPHLRRIDRGAARRTQDRARNRAGRLRQRPERPRARRQTYEERPTRGVPPSPTMLTHAHPLEGLPVYLVYTFRARDDTHGTAGAQGPVET